MRFARALGDFFDQDRTVAIGAGRRQGLAPGGELALRVAVAAVKHFAPARLSFFQIALFALRALDADIERLFQRLDVLAFGVTAAAEKPAELAPAQQHWPAALLATLLDFLFHHHLDRARLVALEIFRALALGILRTGEEFAVASPLDNHQGAAFFAGDIGRHFLALNVAHFLLR